MNDTLCRDCGVETWSTEWGVRCEVYMLKDDLWKQLAPDDPRFAEPPQGMNFFLCVGCAEQRLGRRLVAGDFSDARMNDLSICDTERWAWSWRSNRLINRLSKEV